jgi:hypothetical protein
MSTSGSLMPSMMNELAVNVTGVIFQETAHWIPEERPAALTEAVLRFLNGANAA